MLGKAPKTTKGEVLMRSGRAVMFPPLLHCSLGKQLRIVQVVRYIDDLVFNFLQLMFLHRLIQEPLVLVLVNPKSWEKRNHH